MAPIYLVTKLSVQWQIGNQCNFRCDYCHRDYHNGSNPFLVYDEFEKAFSNLEASVSAYDKVVIELQGGEPTLSPAVRNKLVDSNNPKYKFVLHTNASADLEWWNLAIKNLDKVILAYHPQVDTDHFKKVVSLITTSCPDWAIVINAHNDPIRWQSAIDMYEYYKDQNIPVTLRLLFADHYKGNSKFLDYTPEQWDYYTLESNLDVPKTEPVETQIHWVEDRLYNNYKGHLCWAGIEQIVIDYWGYAYRSWCHAHGTLGNVLEGPIKLDTSPKVCPRDLCKNAFDQQAKKSEKSWGI